MSTFAVMTPFDEKLNGVRASFASRADPLIIRLYSPRQVVEQRGTIGTDYPIARKAAEGF
jgi:isocitrate lyase